jgi:tetratricopeptide (TPR) repeat protein
MYYILRVSELSLVIRIVCCFIGFTALAFLSVSCRNDIITQQNNNLAEKDSLIAEEAVQLYYQGQYEESLRKLKYLKKEYPKAPELSFWEAKNYRDLNQVENSLASYAEAIGKDSSVARYYNNRGLLYLDNGQEALAYMDFKEALILDPDLSAGWNNLGLYFSRVRNDSLAIVAYKRAIGLDPFEPKALYNKGISEINLGNFDEAEIDMDNVIKLQPENYNAYLYRGISAHKLSKYLSGCEDIKKAYEKGVLDALNYIEYCKEENIPKQGDRSK